MWPKLRRCAGCEKLIGARDGRARCAVCQAVLDEQIHRVERVLDTMIDPTPETVAHAAGLTVGEVNEAAAASPSLRRRIPERRPCPRCKRRPVETGAKLCRECLLHVDDELSSVADRIMREIRRGQGKVGIKMPRPLPRAAAGGVAQTLAEKRQMAPTARFNPTAKNKYRG